MKLWPGRRGAPSHPTGEVSRPVLAPVGIEFEGHVFSPSLVTLYGGASPQAEAFHQSAAELLAHHFRRGRRGLAVVSPSIGAGATFVCGNLGVALAQSGASTLLVDANLERPGLSQLVQTSGEGRGLVDLLADTGLQVQDLIEEDVIPNLSLLYAGSPDAGKRESIGAARFDVIMEACLRAFDCVLVDAPPANLSAEARRVATVLGYALVVARPDVTFAEDLGVLRRELEQDGVTVVGSLLNAA